MAQACLQRRSDKPRLSRVAWRPRQSGCHRTANARVMVACARPRLVPMNECRRWADEVDCEAHDERTYGAQPDGRLPSPTP